jgi:hypothetical protein
MTVAHDIALTVDLISMRLDDLAWDRYIRVGQADPVKLDLQKPLTDKTPRFLGCFEVALQIATSGENRFPELLKTSELAQNRVTNLGGLGGEIRFVECAVEKRSSRYNDFLGPCARLTQQKEQG